LTVNALALVNANDFSYCPRIELLKDLSHFIKLANCHTDTTTQ